MLVVPFAIVCILLIAIIIYRRASRKKDPEQQPEDLEELVRMAMVSLMQIADNRTKGVTATQVSVWIYNWIKEHSMPADIKTEPNAKLIFNAPFAEKNRYNLTIANLGAHRMGWAIKTTNMKRLAVDPPAGVLDPKEQQSLFVSCEPFSYETEDTNNDSITFEWTNAPEGAAKQFRREWFQGGRMIRRKNIPIEYNL